MFATLFGVYCILLDTGCNAPVVKMRQCLKKIRRSLERQSSKTLGGAYVAPYVADSVAFGQVYYDMNIPFTILSYYIVATTGYIQPISEFKFVAGFPTYVKGQFIEVEFNFIDGMLMGDGRALASYYEKCHTYFTRNPSMSRLNEGKIKNGKPVRTRWSSTHPDLPKNILLRHTRLVPDMTDAQLEKLNSVWRLLRNSWHCSKRDLIDRIESGKLTNTHVNPEDIKMFFKTFKFDVSKFQGSAKRTKLSAPKLSIRCNPTKKEIAITGDLLEVCSILFMNTISMQHKHTCIEYISSKDNTNVVESLVSICRFYENNGYTVKYIYFDSEAAVIHYKDEIEAAGCTVITATHGTKVGLAEMNNRCVDERFASQFASLIYQANAMIVQWMVIAVGHVLNVSLRKFEDEVIIPHEMIDTTPIDANYFYAFSPCDAVELLDENVSPLKTITAIPLCPEVKTMTAWRFYLPKTHETIPRHVNSARLVDFPSDLISIMERNAQLFPVKPEPRLNIKGTEYDPIYDVPKPISAPRRTRNRGVPRRRIRNFERNFNRDIEDVADGEPQNDNNNDEPNIEEVVDDDNNDNNEPTLEEVVDDDDNNNNEPIPEEVVEDDDDDGEPNEEDVASAPTGSIEAANDGVLSAEVATTESRKRRSEPVETELWKLRSRQVRGKVLLNYDKSISECIDPCTLVCMTRNGREVRGWIDPAVAPPSDDFVMVASSPSIMIDDAATIEENETVFSATNMHVVKCGFVDYNTIKDGCTFTISRASAKEAVKLYGETATYKSLVEEIDGLLARKCFHGVLRSKLTETQEKRRIRMSIFLKEKLDSKGNFIKLKSRLVAGGHLQIKDLFAPNEISSPTVSINSVFMVIAMGVSQHRNFMTFDIAQAYLNAPMPEEHDVHMTLDELTTRILCEIDPSYKKFLPKVGKQEITVKLDKALYGCVQSARLWYNTLSKYMKSIGFQPNPVDVCVFNRTDESGNQTTVCFHVDDGLATSSSMNDLQKLERELKEEFGENMSVTYGDEHEYLGMSLDVSSGSYCEMTMSKYIENLVTDVGVEGDRVADSPASNALFLIPDSDRLCEKDRELFHRHVARLLYLATRVRPDILLAVTFLCSRVACATKVDQVKLKRVVSYLKGTSDLGKRLGGGPNGEVTLQSFSDASFAVHSDMKSHNGQFITLGLGGILIKCNKEKLVTKSSTEAELVCLSDGVGLASHCAEFLKYQGYNLTPELMQDNMSTIKLAEKGKSTSDRTRHVKIRYFFVNQFLENGEMKIKYCPTEAMVADILTKPIVGSQFKTLAKQLLGYERPFS